jgi:hypothetical protein
MNAKYYGLVDLGIAFAAVAVFVIHQLWTLRDRGGDPPPDER